MKDHNGQLIASLSDNNLYVKEGYEPYFHVIESERGSRDFMKICYVEKGWQISYDGTGTGEMTVLKADIQDGRIVNPGVSEPIKITDESSGNIEDIIVQIDHGTAITNPFTDVKSGAYYYEPVLWALENNITTGITPTLFKPNEGCTRAQIVTFLWRLAGSPDVKASAGFTDVPKGK
ncbi:MAG: S-layer homology domain-containing protein, partial [Solobacterium sp.]|nr:S-layer homology domain-containing protein [Solobacterium sp.]